MVNDKPRSGASSLAGIRSEIAHLQSAGKRIVFTNGCFDILHAGHVDILTRARALGDYLVVGLNSDASVRRLKGPTRPVHDEAARAAVLRGLRAVDEVIIFEEDTPIETIAALHPDIHVKGGDYTPEQLPEAATVLAYGGEIVILPLVEGYSTTKALQKSQAVASSATIVIPARFGSTRFPGKPLVKLAGETVISRVVRAALTTRAARPIIVATDHDGIAAEIATFPPEEAIAVMTSEACHTGTDRLAEAVRARLGEPEGRTVIVNIQGDEPFIKAEHVDALIRLMESDPNLRMATLATPIFDPAQETDPNVVKAVVDARGRALYFSRATVPYDRDNTGTRRFRHLGLYAYEANWLLKMASLPPSPLEETEKLEQLRALEAGVEIGVAIVEDVVPIAIDTPEDLERAEAYLGAME